MKFRLRVSDENYERIKAYLAEHDIGISEDAEFVISESSGYPGLLNVRNEKKERLRIPAAEVVFIESFGKEIEIHTMRETYFSRDRMYQLESLLDPKEFLRISKSVIISKKHVKKIRPSLSMKFVLTMSDGNLVDVTRSYYSDFRRFFEI